MRRLFFDEWPEDWPLRIAWLASVSGAAYGDLYQLAWPQLALRYGAHAKLEEERAEAIRAAREGG